MVFVDITNTFNTFNTDDISRVLKKLAIPDKMLNLILLPFQRRMKAAVMSDREHYDSFDVKKSTKTKPRQDYGFS